MYELVLFGHVLGVALLISAVVMTLSGLLRAQRAATVAQVQVAMGGAPVADLLIPPMMALVWASGLYLVSRHGAGGAIRWNSGWVDVSLTIVALMSVLGPAVEVRRSTRLRQAAQAAPAGPVTGELDRLRRDPVLTHVTVFGSSQLIVLLYLMTNKPALAPALAVAITAGLISLALARLALRTAGVVPIEVSPPAGLASPR